MPAIEIARQNLGVSRLRAAAARTADAKQARRILAIAMGRDGPSRRLAAQARGIGRRTPRGFVHRSNVDALAGLADRPRPLRLAASGRSPIERTGEACGGQP